MLKFCIKIAPSGWGTSSVYFLILKSACGSCATPLLPGRFCSRKAKVHARKKVWSKLILILKESFISFQMASPHNQNGARGQPQPPQIQSPIRAEIGYHLRLGVPAPNRPHHAREGLGDWHRQGSQIGTYFFLGRREGTNALVTRNIAIFRHLSSAGSASNTFRRNFRSCPPTINEHSSCHHVTCSAKLKKIKHSYFFLSDDRGPVARCSGRL